MTEQTAPVEQPWWKSEWYKIWLELATPNEYRGRNPSIPMFEYVSAFRAKQLPFH